MLHVHHSASGEELVKALAGVLASGPADPFAPDIVSVPAKGVERWIAQRLSHHLGAAEHGDGVCAQVLFPRPDDLLDSVLAEVSDEYAAAVDAWHPDRSVWALLDVLDRCLPAGDWCAGLHRHLGLDGAGDSTRRYAVARRITRLFASYAAARPHVIRAWAAKDDAGVPDDLTWQPTLWRLLRETLNTPSPAQILDDACEALRKDPAAVSLANRLSVYGATRIDHSRLQVLAALAEHRDVHLFIHHPSPALWRTVEAAQPPTMRRADADLAVPVSHPLLASTARDVRELQLRLRQAAPDHRTSEHPRAAATKDTLLRRLQADLRADRVPAERLRLDPDDRSVQVHACHGRARQVETLREVVLGILADDPTIEPRDVLVMCPDVETYAPIVAAVFGTDSHPGGKLRVSIADRSPRQTNPLLGVAATLLELAASRVTGAQVLDLAAASPVKLRFGLSDDDVEQLRSWIVATGVHWGLDAEHRTPYRMGRVEQGTWRAGLDRLLTGVALGETDAVFGKGTLPLDGVESTDADLAGRVAELVDRLDATLKNLTANRPVTQWLDAIEQGVDALAAAPPDSAWQAAQLRNELDAVREAAAGSRADLTLADVTALLSERLQVRPTRTSFRTGDITVCTLTPMRHVPHRVICLLGLDDGAFPRHTLPDGDDLLARDPHIGERDLRSEDRQLFLDAILAAGDHLVVTYSGADVRTGAELPPAVPLGELLDALDATAVTADGKPARTQVVVHHPLQPFDPKNFAAGALGRPGPLSFDQTALSGAQALCAQRAGPPPFLGESLPAPSGDEARHEVHDVLLQQLIQFFQHPVRGFLSQRLQVSTTSRNEEPDDAMPVELDNLAEWQIGDRVLLARMDGVERDAIRASEAARGDLPPPPLGDRVLSEIGRRVEAIVAECAPYTGHDATTLDVEIPLDADTRIVGAVNCVRGDVVLTVTYARLKPKQRLRAWMELLALTAADPSVARRAVVIGRGDRDSVAVATLGPVTPATAKALLTELVQIRAVGLRVPLPLPVAASAAYAAARAGGKPADAAYAAARKEWVTTYGWNRDDADAEHALVWGDPAPFDVLLDWPWDVPAPGSGWDSEPSAFARLARRVWDPLLEADHGKRARR